MSKKPWMTSDQLIAAVKRKISFPAAQATFTDEEILDFANEEMLISQVPSILLYHEEYFVYVKRVPLRDNVSKYPIPDRAIGMRLRDVFWSDVSGNIYEMTKVSPEDKSYYQRNSGTNESLHKYYLQNNEIIIAPQPTTSLGSINFDFFLRPNQLVPDERAAIMESFSQTITVDVSTLVAGDTVIIDNNTFTAVASGAGANEFNIEATSILTATGLVTSINNASIGVTAANVAGSSAVVTLTFTDLEIAMYVPDSRLFTEVASNITSSNSSALSIPSTLTLNFESVPDFFVAGDLFDLLETRPGHKIKNYDVVAQSVSGNSMTFNLQDIPVGLSSDDYVCVAHECIIPNIPPDLHNGLAERTGARILSALGDQAGLAASNAKIEEINQRQGTLLDSRVDGSPSKITARHSVLRYGRVGPRKRF